MDEAHAHEMWAHIADVSRTTVPFLLARPLERLDIAYDPPPCPNAYELIATDGSQLDVDRHGVLPYGLINIGRVFLRYGATPAAKLVSIPTLCSSNDGDTQTGVMQQTVLDEAYLSARRDIAEIEALIPLADEFLSGSMPTIAILDGTLIRWQLASTDSMSQQRLLQSSLAALDALHERNIPVVSYISRPRTIEVVGLIRLMHCPHVHTDTCPNETCTSCNHMATGRISPCNALHRLTDADVLVDTLRVGQRGPLFCSLSRINVEHYGPHLVHFFYLHVGHEIARVEMPAWVAKNSATIDLIHALIYDQATRGQGYPVGLARAHEQAVIRPADRRALLRLIERSLLRSELPVSSSQKAVSKRHIAF
jgi:hypothetical protein